VLEIEYEQHDGGTYGRINRENHPIPRRKGLEAIPRSQRSGSFDLARVERTVGTLSIEEQPASHRAKLFRHAGRNC
jgi:hypothetical protein